MNSLNHYAYGAVSEWIYRSVCGIASDETAVGFKKAVLALCPDRRLGWVKGEFSSAAGVYESEGHMKKMASASRSVSPLTAPPGLLCRMEWFLRLWMALSRKRRRHFPWKT